MTLSQGASASGTAAATATPSVTATASSTGSATATGSAPAAPTLCAPVVLAGSSVVSTGPTVVYGDVAVNPGTSVTGFNPPGVYTGALDVNTPAAIAAQAAVTAMITELTALGPSAVALGAG